MGVGSWEPAKTHKPLELPALWACISQSEAGDLLSLAASLTDSQQQAGAHWMKQAAAYWQAAETLSDEELRRVITFFTLAEMQLPGWDAGKQSPVIYLVKILKQRGSFSPELRQWIKANTDNRYLPNGALV
ncbi:MAG: hypothetical protein ACI8PP_000223 [Candidatus Pseudothioglobus sp.]|jgi:hypothetical protein